MFGSHELVFSAEKPSNPPLNEKASTPYASFHFFIPLMQAPNPLIDLKLFLHLISVVSSSCTIFLRY